MRLLWVAMGVSDQIADARHWVTEHKLKAIGTRLLTFLLQLNGWSFPENIVRHACLTAGGLWATGIVGSLGFQWSRPIPTQMKIIHSRVYSQVCYQDCPLTIHILHCLHCFGNSKHIIKLNKTAPVYAGYHARSNWICSFS